MSGNKDSDKLVRSASDEEPRSHAFEYVAGTLTREERQALEATLPSDEDLQREIAFWEEQLMPMVPNQSRTPKVDTWDSIAAGLERQGSKAEHPKQEAATARKMGVLPFFDWASFWQWGAPSFAAVALMFVLFGYSPVSTTPDTDSQPNTDYVAVLTDSEGAALLTALSTANEQSMWLKWEGLALKPETSAQLWAISKRDGEARPITVFENLDEAQLALDEAEWRLVTDAAFLLLTEEELGGSAIDEPSDTLIAKGVCVRFSAVSSST